jgi:tetratricopeptide (TPR) repeat protein
MKKLSLYVLLVLLFGGNTIAETEDRNLKLDQLFEQLKKSNNVSIALEIEIKIWDIWLTHPTKEGLTQSLAKGSDLMSKGELDSAYKIFSTIINSAPAWAEGWNKRATVLYLMGRYHDSLNDIEEVFKHESRHFGALSGQGLVQTKLGNYEKAIKSYQAVQKIYPSMKSAKIMIPQLRKLIKDESI